MDFRDELPGDNRPARVYRVGAGLSGAVLPVFGRPARWTGPRSPVPGAGAARGRRASPGRVRCRS